MLKFNTRNPWQAGLIAATALSAIAFYANLLSDSGNTQWAFLLVFGSVWCLIALFWANDSFIEESGMVLAETMDKNIELLHNRLVNLERELAKLREQAQAAAPPAQGRAIKGIPGRSW
ncbi:MAG TPA: hypothetical protein VJN01_15660 [Xanthomonadales bacterium]|nr:hypothetical protein [Xanthomonadales bacterium]